jgi:uncharacterized protein (TIGR01244 family)
MSCRRLMSRALSTTLVVAAALAASACTICPTTGKLVPLGGCGTAAPGSGKPAVVGGTEAPEVAGAPVGWVAATGVVITSQPPDAAWTAYSAAGFRTVVNFRPSSEGADRERDLVAANGMQYFHVPVVGTGITWGDADALAKILGDGNNRDVLLHCSSGNRVAGVWALYQHRHRGLRPEAAIAEGRRVAPLKPKMAEKLEVMLGLREEPCVPCPKKLARGVQEPTDSSAHDRRSSR